MMKKLAFVAALLAAPGTGLAQESYCVAGSTRAGEAAFEQSAATAVREHCRPGEVIFLTRPGRISVGLLCDFSKAITEVGGAVVCVLAPPRAIRN